jgi:hypothetical protein
VLAEGGTPLRSFSLDFVEERRRGGGHGAVLRCRLKGPALRSVACFRARRAVGIRQNSELCVFYYYRTYLQSCSRGGGRRVEDMCYERRRAEDCVD